MTSYVHCENTHILYLTILLKIASIILKFHRNTLNDVNTIINLSMEPQSTFPVLFDVLGEISRETAG